MNSTENSTLKEDEKDEKEEHFLQWYTDMVENYPNTFVHYLSDDALLQWFGRSVRGPEKILYFIKSQMQGTKHLLHYPEPSECTDNPIINKKTFKSLIDESLMTTSSSNVEFVSTNGSTPKELIESDAFACGDGPNIDKLALRDADQHNGNECSTSKKRAITTNIFETNGAIEFTKPYFKRGVSETRWERPCKLKIGYSGNLSNPVDFNIQLIIYGDNTTCKRNLLPEFEKCTEFDA